LALPEDLKFKVQGSRFKVFNFCPLPRCTATSLTRRMLQKVKTTVSEGAAKPLPN
jgi:hypothetical protein